MPILAPESCMFSTSAAKRKYKNLNAKRCRRNGRQQCDTRSFFDTVENERLEVENERKQDAQNQVNAYAEAVSALRMAMLEAQNVLFRELSDEAQAIILDWDRYSDRY